jgi:hypothetical protein
MLRDMFHGVTEQLIRYQAKGELDQPTVAMFQHILNLISAMIREMEPNE